MQEMPGKVIGFIAVVSGLLAIGYHNVTIGGIGLLAAAVLAFQKNEQLLITDEKSRSRAINAWWSWVVVFTLVGSVESVALWSFVLLICTATIFVFFVAKAVYISTVDILSGEVDEHLLPYDALMDEQLAHFRDN